MSKLKDLVSRGVRLIVSDGEAQTLEPHQAAQPREIPADAFDVEPPAPVERSRVQADVEDLGAVYGEAGIELPLHGYGVDKVGEMLDNKRLSTLSREVKASAVLAALEAASVPIREVIQDAVRRDQALDAFLAAKTAEVQELKGQTDARVSAIREEIDAFLRAKNAEIEALKGAADASSAALVKLQERKRREEDRLSSIVAHFVQSAENPITSGESAAPDKPASA